MLSSLSINEHDNNDDIINPKSKNEHSTYESLTKDEIIEKINDKKKKIIEYHNINKSLKKELCEILDKLNTFSKNYLLEQSPNKNNLQIKLNNKKKEFVNNKSNNSLLKNEYNMLLKRTREISGKKLSNLITEKKIFVDKLKHENFELKKEINKNQSESAKTQNEVLKMTNNNLYLHNLDSCAFKFKKYLDSKNKYIKAFNTTKKLLNEKMKEVNNLENTMPQKNNNIYSINGYSFNKIKEDLSIIKTDIREVLGELDKKNINEDILVLNNILQKNELSTNANTTNNNPNNIFITKNIYNNNNNQNKIKSNYSKFYNINTHKNKIRLKPLLNKSNSASLIKNNLFSNKSSLNLYNSNINKKNLFLFNKNTTNEISTNSSISMNNCLSYNLSKIKFLETDDEAYQILLNKKENYMEESERITKNITQAHRIFVFKNNKMMKNLKANMNELNEIKNTNKELQNQITKLQDLILKLKTENKKILENGDFP